MTTPRGAVRAAGAVLALALLLVAAAATSDPHRPAQWALDRIGAEPAWTVARGEGQIVAVIDSGVDLQHPDLVDRLYRSDGVVVGTDYVDGGDPQDALGHGSMVSGVIAASTDNGIGIAAVAPAARIMPIRVLDEEGKGNLADVEDAIDWAVEHGATVINLSLETVVGDSGAGTIGVGAPVRAVRDAWDAGVPVVAAAGNSGNPFTDYPPTSPVVLVGATDKDDQRADFSDTGRNDMLMAPGVDIRSTWCRPNKETPCDGQTHNYGIAEGTSFAAPHVAAAIAILRSSGLNHEQAVQRLRATARDLGPAGRDLETGYGLIDLVAATGASTGGTPSPTTSPSSPAPSPPPSPTTTPASTDQPSAAPTATPPVSEDPATPSPTATPSVPTENPSTPEPTVDPTPVVSEAPDPSAAPAPTDPARGPWSALAAALIVVTAVMHGRAAAVRSRR